MLLLTRANKCFATRRVLPRLATGPMANRLTGCSVRLQWSVAGIRVPLSRPAEPQLAEQRNDFVAPIRFSINGFTPC